MRVFVACEFSGRVRDAFIRNGHEAYSCDLPEVEPEGEFLSNHIQGNCIDYLNNGWDLLIAHPPCTYLANSGVWALKKHPERYDDMIEACAFFNTLLNSDIPYICVENPIQHGYARKYIRKYDQIIQPWMFGHGETKATCLWLKNLPKLTPTNIVEGREPKILKMPPSKTRQRDRSRTYTGIAEAMATQWSL